jgi:predicted nucleic acid-binding protein
MSFVVDASVAIAWAFNERHATAARTRARLRGEAAIVPSLWWYEVRNVLVLGERQGRLTERKTARFLRGISRLAVAMDGSLMKARFSLSLANTGSPSMMPPILSWQRAKLCRWPPRMQNSPSPPRPNRCH